MPTYRTTITLDHPALGGTGTNTWHCRTTSDVVSDDPELAGLTGMLEDFYGNMEAVLAGSTVIRFNGEWTRVGGTGTIDNSQDPWTVTVGGAVDCMPPANSVVIGWRTSAAGRTAKGRTFLGPMDSGAAQGNGTVDDTILNAIRGNAAALIDASDSFANGAFGVFSVKDGVLRDFVSAAVRDQFAVLRSRRD